MVKKNRSKHRRTKHRRTKHRRRYKKTRKYYGGFRFTVEEEQNPISYNDITEISQSNFSKLNLD